MRTETAVPRYLTGRARPQITDTREDGLALVSRVNRWMIAGAVIIAAAVTGVTAHSFHAHHAASASANASPASRQSSAFSQAAAAAAGLQSPSQAPSQAPAQAPAPATPAPVVSGGS